MARIAYVLLCHKDAARIIAQVRDLTVAGDSVTIHFDASAPAADFARLQGALAGNPRVAFTPRRLRCGWGEWSLVAAMLLGARTALAAFPEASHVYMISGDCLPIKTAEYAHDLLGRDDADWIESVDFFTSGWIKTGMREDRLHYRHWFNERSRKRLFYLSLDVQRRLGLRRSPPADLDIMIGSQWWCLRRATVEAVLAFLETRPDVIRFFRTTWIPDETFFQTLVRHLVPDAQIRNRPPTFLMFTDYGMPVTFHDDHYDLLLGQGYLFARKISPDAQGLRARLGALYAARGLRFEISDEGRRLHAFLTGRGRIGRRFGRRFWEVEASLGRERELLIVASKKWDVGLALSRRLSALAGVPAVGYLFNDEGTPLPDLGGIETSLAKRARHRRALLRLLYDACRSDRLLICIDPGSFELIEDFSTDRATTRVLEVDSRMSDDWLAGHARRIGLAGEHTPKARLEQLLPTLRGDIAAESARLRDAGLARLTVLREGADAAETARALAAFAGVPPETAARLAAAPDLFGG
mgnify:CR=1 FL=1